MCDRIKELLRKRRPEEEKTPLNSDSRMNWLNTISFCVFGTFTFFTQELILIASEDILSGRHLPTATVLVCYVTPLMITKIVSPWFVQKITYVAKTSFITLCMIIGLSLIVFVEDIKVKLAAIALNAIAAGASEVIFLGLTSFYPQICISAFVAGTGMSSLISPLYYTGKRNVPVKEIAFLLLRYIYAFYIISLPFQCL